MAAGGGNHDGSLGHFLTAQIGEVLGVEVIAVDSLTQAAAFLIEQLAIEPTPSRGEQLFEQLGAYEASTTAASAAFALGRMRPRTLP